MDMQTLFVLALAVVLLVLGVIFLIMFRSELSSLISRVKSISKGEISIAEKMPEGRVQTRGNANAPSFEDQFDSHSRSAIQVEREKAIRTELDSRNIINTEERIKFLIRATAFLGLSAEFERVSRLIFGSQLGILVDLNALVNGRKYSEVKALYENKIQTQFAELKDYSFERYLAFLTNFNLVSTIGEDVKITAYGREFLQYLVKEGQTYVRAL